VGRHSAQTDGRANLAKVAGLAGMATAAAALAMTVGTGTAQAKPNDGFNNIFHSNKSDSGSANKPASGSTPTATVNAQTTAARNPSSSSTNIGSVLSSIAPSLYNPGPFTVGPVTSTPTGVIVKPPVPGTKPFAQVTGIQLPFWTVNNGTPVPPA
jgi:hypothetical protein